MQFFSTITLKPEKSLWCEKDNYPTESSSSRTERSYEYYG